MMGSPKHIYAFLLILVLLWCGGIVLAPLLVAGSSGSQTVGSWIYAIYSKVCHQLDGRSFHLAGEKFGVCMRCSSIYFGFLASLLMVPVLGSLDRLRVPRRGWLAVAAVPMIVDVLLTVTGAHPSTALTRVASGCGLGFVLPWYLLPPLVEAVSQLRTQLSARGGILHARETE